MNQDTPLSKSAQTVQAALRSKGFAYNVQELTATTRTTQDATSALRCEVAQIVKSLLFRTATQEPILVLMSGSNRVDEKKLAKLLGMDVLKADADFTRKVTGFAIGGIPPLKDIQPHADSYRISHVFIDEDLLQFSTCWAAAGTPNAIFNLNTVDLVQLSGGKIVDIKS